MQEKIYFKLPDTPSFSSAIAGLYL